MTIQVSKLFVLILLLGTPFAVTIEAHNLRSSTSLFAQPQTDPGTALNQGRALLKQGHADQALGYLQTALNGYTQAKNPRGIAASEDGLGDLYMIQGQYPVALEHYQKAYQAFATAASTDQTNQAATSSVAGLAGSTAGAAAQTAGTIAANNAFNANLMLAKIGDTNYHLGRMSEANTAYAMMSVKKPESAAAKAGRRFGGLGGVITSIGTGYKPPCRPSDALVTDVNCSGTRMLSALVATNAMPRSTHIVPRVMMKGCTRKPTTRNPFSTPQSSPTPMHVTSPTRTVAGVPAGPSARNARPIITPARA